MPALRGYSSVLDGTAGLGSGQPAIEGYRIVRQIDARSIDCPSCSGLAGEACSTGRMSTGRHPLPLLCADRLNLAKLLAESGELEVTVIEPTTGCRLCSSQNGRILACAEHRCQERGCTGSRDKDSEQCAKHCGQRGGKLKMTPAKVARMNQLRAEGWTQVRIAAELGVSPATLIRYWKQLPNSSLGESQNELLTKVR